MLRKGILFGLITALAVILGFYSFHGAPYEAVSLIRIGGYWQILALAGLFAFCLFRSVRADARSAGASWRSWFWPALAMLGVAVFLHVQEPHEFKILADEAVLQDTAMDMHFHRSASVLVRGYDLAGTFTPLEAYVDKRPLFFPFLVSLVHDLTGYRIENAFVVNAIVTVALVLLVFLLGRRLAGNPAGYAGILLLASIPLVHQNATGSGFELLNLMMIALTIWLGMRYVEQPDTDRLGAFVFSGILLAQTRYESALFILPVGVVILYQWWRQRQIEFRWPVMVAPLMLVIVPLNFNVFKLATSSWQLNDIVGADTPFSPRYFYENVGHALNFFFSVDNVQPSSFLVSLLGVIGVSFFVLLFYREHRRIFSEEPARAVFCLFIGGLLLHSLLMLCYFWGHFDDPVIRRLSLPAHLLFILSFLAIYPSLVPHRSRWHWLSGITLLFIFSVTVPLTAMHRYDAENIAARTNNWVSQFIDTLGDDTALAIDGDAGLQWFIHQKSSMPVDALASAPDKYVFIYRNRSFRHFFVVQRMGTDFATGAIFPSADDDVGDGLTLEPIAERAFSPIYRVRISRVVAVDPAKLKAWAERRGKAVKVTPQMQSSIKASDYDRIDSWFRMLP